jgi:transposase
MNNPAYCWAPRGMRPGVQVQRVREYTYVYSALSPQDGELFSLILPYADTDRMELFLDELAKRLGGGPALIVMDQAAWHKAATLMEKHPNILVAYQPPYSPELNPVEHLWKHLRQNHMKNHYSESMDDLEDSLQSALKDCAQERETMRSLAAFNWMKGL